MARPLIDAVIVDAVRTPIGKHDGRLRHWHPVDLVSELLVALADRNDLDPAVVDDVVLGCVMQVGEQAVNVARNAVLAAGWPEHVPGATIDRQCGSAQQAVHFAAQGIAAGAYDVVVAGGVEVMTRVPMGASMIDGRYGYPFGPRVGARYSDLGGLVPQGVAAELIADRWDLTRDELDEYAAMSQARAQRAVLEGRFDRELVPVSGVDGTPVIRDEGIRPTTLEGLARLEPVFRPAADGGRVTAGNACQISDGAAAVLLMSAARAAQLGLRPLARCVAFAVAGSDPRLMLTGCAPATSKALARAGVALADVDLFEVNEAFAPVVLAWERELGPDADLGRVNVNGGAIALGHPLGASGARIVATLVHELDRRGARYGLATIGEGGGMANAMLVEGLA